MNAKELKLATSNLRENMRVVVRVGNTLVDVESAFVDNDAGERVFVITTKKAG